MGNYKNTTTRRWRQVVIVLLAALPVVGSAQSLEVRYWGGIPGRVEYELAVLEAALVAGGDAPYEIELVDESLGSLRGRQEVARGERVNVYASSYRADALLESGAVKMIRVPLLKGLLGYRSAIVRREQLPTFAAMDSLAQLRRYTVGQGHEWSDVAIYRHNGIGVDDSGRFPLLLRMLAHRRFDILLLGIMEAEPVLADSEFADQLAVVPNLVVYYPYPLVFYVSAKHSELATRLSEGMATIASNGTLESMFQRYYGETLRQLSDGEYSVIILQHPVPAANMGLDTPMFLPQRQP